MSALFAFFALTSFLLGFVKIIMGDVNSATYSMSMAAFYMAVSIREKVK